jgi:hypothetical protein
VDTDTLAEFAHKSTREEFVARLEHSFLVLETGLDEADGVGFSTQVVDPVSLRRSTFRRTTNIEVLAIVKAPGNPYPDRVSIGRARNCDIVMRDPSVSKLHAHFRVDGSKLELVDIDSQNGTRINGRALPPHQPSPVENGDTLLVGSVAAKLVDANALYDLLR